MALTTAQQVRLRIQDQPLLYNATLYGDGTANTFYFPQRNITGATAYVPLGGTAWSATGATWNASGYVQFGAAISAASAFRVTFQYSTFSDDEVDHFITAGGGVLGASIEAVQTLMFDSLKRAAWKAPDGTEYDDTAAMRQLNDMYDRLKDEETEQADYSAGFQSWAAGQGDI